jgi:hypothetical protein
MKVFAFVLLALLIYFTACGKINGTEAHISSAIKHDSIIKAHLNMYVDSCWNRGDTTFLSQIATDRFSRNLNGITVAKTKREMQAHMNLFFIAFPDLQLTLGKAYVSDNTVFLHWTSSGSNTGIFGETMATGKKVTIEGLSQLYFDSEGKLYGEDVMYNELDLLQQLGYTLNLPNLK